MPAASFMLNKQHKYDIPVAYGTTVPISTEIFIKLRCVCMLAQHFDGAQGSSVSTSWEGPPPLKLLRTD